MSWFSLESRPHHVIDALLDAPPSPQPRAPMLARLFRLATRMSPEEPFCWVRLAFLNLRERSRPDALPEVLRIADRLEASAPDDPDRLFLDGYLHWLVASSSPDPPAGGAAKLARGGLRASWGKLLRRHPSYEGPGGVGVDWLREQLQSARQ